MSFLFLLVFSYALEYPLERSGFVAIPVVGVVTLFFDFFFQEAEPSIQHREALSFDFAKERVSWVVHFSKSPSIS
jgi:hypothetical protein